MKNVTKTSVKNSWPSASATNDEIPDPKQWVEEHHFLASFVHTLTHLKEIFPDSIFHEDSYCDYLDGKLLIDDNTVDLLKANYTDDHWQYLENYLLVWEA
ncbi:hypothetical protein BCD67_11335 [Oscillatoriales cyanobacterium USR001]|nr:hypothetical protein BCD67_11335 [Oscillatoriales cyanobacterium USR001]